MRCQRPSRSLSIHLIAAVLWGLVGPVFLANGPVVPPPAESGKVEAPMEVSLSFSPPPLLARVAALTLSVRPLVDAPDTTVQIVLPEGFELVRGSLTWQGDIPKDDTVGIEVTVRAVRAGEWAIVGEAVSEAAGGVVFGRAASLYVTLTATASTVSEEPTVPTVVSVESVSELIPGGPALGPTGGIGESRKPRPYRAGAKGSGTEVPLGTIAVYGYWYYRDKSDVDHPLQNARVEIWDDDDTVGDDDLLDTVRTNGSGWYSATVLNDEAGGQDIFVKIWSTDDHSVRVEDFSGGKYYSQTPVADDVPDGSHNVGSYYITDANNRMAWFIYDKIANDAWHYLSGQVGWDNNYNLQVRWTPTSTHGTHYHNGGSIDLLAGDRWDEDVILHEYGHFVMDKTYATYPPTPNCSPHWWGGHSSLGCAWSEGWATFLQGAIQGHDDYIDTEDQTLHIYMEPPSPTAHHPEDEGAVGASLWDVFDGGTEPWDALANGLNGSANNGIWRILYQDDPDSVQGFWNDWLSSANGYCPEVWSILDHHLIDSDDSAPSNPSNVWSPSHATFSWSNDNTVTMAWSGASDAGGSGVNGYSFSWTTSSGSLPDTSVDTTGSTTTSTVLSDNGNWYFHLRTSDNAGNWNGTAVHSGPYRVDTEAPASGMTTLPVSQTAISFSVSWQGSDPSPGSGVDSYDVQYRAGSGGTWTDWLLDTTLTSSPFGPSAPVRLESGQTYFFRCRARDQAGNLESYQSGDGDTSTTVTTVELYLPTIQRRSA